MVYHSLIESDPNFILEVMHECLHLDNRTAADHVRSRLLQHLTEGENDYVRRSVMETAVDQVAGGELLVAWRWYYFGQPSSKRKSDTSRKQGSTTLK